jgi:hypothetical protein
MATATLRPNGTIYGGGSLTGGAGSTHATLSDDSDGTYASKATGSPPDHVRMGTTTKPAGSVLFTIRPWMKLQSPSGTTKADFWATAGLGAVYGLSVNTTPTIYYGPTVIVGDQSQAWIDALEMAYRTPSGSNTRFLEAGIDLVFPEPPTCTVSAPTGTVTTSAFDMTWAHTPGTDGGGQALYHLKIFTAAQYGGLGFDPTTSAALYDSGYISSSTSSQPGVLGAGVYRIYVRTAQSMGGTPQWSAWDYEDFIVDLFSPPAEVLEVTTAIEPSDGSVEIIVDRDTSAEAWEYVEVVRATFTNLLGDYGLFETEGSTPGLGDGWALLTTGSSPTSTSVALGTAGGLVGQYQTLNATVDDGDIYKIAFATDCIGGDEMSASAWVNSSLGANGAARISLIFSYNPSYDAQEIADDAFAVYWVDDTTEGVWHPFSLAVTAPTGARRCAVQIEVVGLTGASGAVCSVMYDKVHFTRNWEGSVAVRGVTDVTPGADQVTFFDYEAPPGYDIDYAARAVKDDGTLGAWVWSTQVVNWEASAVYFISIEDPAESRTFDLAEPPEPVEAQRRVVMPIDGAKYPVVVSDGQRSGRQFKMLVKTSSDEDVADLRALCARDVLVIHAPTTYGFASGYWSIGDMKERRLTREAAFRHKQWEIDVVEVDAP